MEFTPGKAFANPEKWNEDIKFLESKGVPVPQFIKKAVDAGRVCFFDSFYFQARQRDIKFNKKSYLSDFS